MHQPVASTWFDNKLHIYRSLHIGWYDSNEYYDDYYEHYDGMYSNGYNEEWPLNRQQTTDNISTANQATQKVIVHS